ncbi:MAG: Eukaryotic phosphomannomutase [Parcubacteria group bacterium]|nr:Eukaryotic phosphomannomutase [Parcubacteria group bacterium]
MIPRVVMFDIDRTLARSKSEITPSMASSLKELLSHTSVGIISGGKLEQFLKQVVDQLPKDTDLHKLYLMPTSGAALHEYRDAWTLVYEERLSAQEEAKIEEVLEKVLKETYIIDQSIPSHGPRIENRGAQVALSALGQQAPVEEKEAWDPSGEKRNALREIISAQLPDFDVKRGGATTIDITKHGINKAFGVRKLSEHLNVPISEMLYIGDELGPNGNDEVVKETGIPTHAVAGPEDTEEFVKNLISQD